MAPLTCVSWTSAALLLRSCGVAVKAFRSASSSPGGTEPAAHIRFTARQQHARCCGSMPALLAVQARPP